MNAKEMLQRCLECDKAWSEGYAVGYQSIAVGAIFSVPKRPAVPSGVTDLVRYFHDLGYGDGVADARARLTLGTSRGAGRRILHVPNL